MAVTVVWDTWLKAGAETEGLRLTRQVWSDMRDSKATCRTTCSSIRTPRPHHRPRPVARPRRRRPGPRAGTGLRDDLAADAAPRSTAGAMDHGRGSAGLRLHSPGGRSPQRGVTHLPPRIVFSTGSNASACRKKPRSVGCELSTVPSLSSPSSFRRRGRTGREPFAPAAGELRLERAWLVRFRSRFVARKTAIRN